MKKLTRFLSRLFLNETFIMTIVILNGIVIFLQCYYTSQEISFQRLAHLDSLFTILFVFEAFVKIKSLTFKGYWSDKWNRWDFVITAITALSLVQYISPNQFTETIGVISAIRTLRVLKLIRLMRFIPNLSSVVNSLRLAVRTSWVIIFAFLIIIFIISIVTCTIFRNIAPEYFANPFDSMYNTFRIFTVEGWYEIPNAITGGESSTVVMSLVRLYFSLILFFGGIIGMGLITSILVDAMAADNNDEVLRQIKSLKEELEKLNEKLDEKEKNDE